MVKIRAGLSGRFLSSRIWYLNGINAGKSVCIRKETAGKGHQHLVRHKDVVFIAVVQTFRGLPTIVTFLEADSLNVSKRKAMRKPMAKGNKVGPHARRRILRIRKDRQAAMLA